MFVSNGSDDRRAVPTETDILVIEDEPADAHLIRDLLDDKHDVAVVDQAGNAIQTLTVLAEENAEPDLVLLDLRLPDGSGFDVLEAVRGQIELDELSIVVLTNSDSDTDRERARALGADEFTTKPMDVDAFERAISDIEQTFLHTGS